MTDATSDAATQHDAPEHHAHGASRTLYVGIGILLTVVTVAEVFAPAWLSDGLELRPSGSLIAILMAFAFAKAGLVAAFYMHLRYDSRIYTGIMMLATVLIAYFLWLLTFMTGGFGFDAF